MFLEALMFRGVLETLAFLEPLNTVVLWWSEGFDGLPSIGHAWLRSLLQLYAWSLWWCRRDFSSCGNFSSLRKLEFRNCWVGWGLEMGQLYIVQIVGDIAMMTNGTFWWWNAWPNFTKFIHSIKAYQFVVRSNVKIPTWPNGAVWTYTQIYTVRSVDLWVSLWSCVSILDKGWA